MYLCSGNRAECFGCEACAQVCPKHAIDMSEDEEGFRYPHINKEMCINCGMCKNVCPYENEPQTATDDKYVWGGYHLDAELRFNSTSGGAFSAIAEAFCDENYVIFGAEAKGLCVRHAYITDISEIHRFQKSKYSQSIIGSSFRKCKKFLKQGKKVLFSGTPCQIAALKNFLIGTEQDNLLTVEVICEGVPSPLYMRKYEKYLEKKYGCKICKMDYRYTGKSYLSSGKWDFQMERTVISGGGIGRWDFEIMRVELMNKKVIKKDRWVNPFWSIWLNHLMSRPSCYECKFAKNDRVADITLGDLWGVHIYCPELYGRNGGSSLVLCNTDKGKKVFQKASQRMYGHELKWEDALRYQAPLRRNIDENPRREEFMVDLQGSMEYKALNKKWAKRPTLKLLVSKYIWGNRQKVALWNLKHRIRKKKCTAPTRK